MAVCDPSQNPAIPQGLRPLQDSEVTPEMQGWAASIANNLAWPIGDFSNRKWFFKGNYKLPIVAGVLCHSYTQQGDQRISGAYHGVTLFQAMTPEWYPVDPTSMEARNATDWHAMAWAGIALLAVGSAFLLSTKHAGKR